ncbi:MAG: ADP-ribosylglycohydrolase family protein, partial [Phycisphaeraceae bacterium]
TLKACLKLWMGVSPTHSGVNSAGNGPAMRSALIGVMADSDEHLYRLVATSTAVTHSDNRAEQGAAVIARLARWVTQPIEQRPALEQVVLDGVKDGQLRDNLEIAMRLGNDSAGTKKFTSELCLSKGVSGFVNHTVPAAVYCWLANRDSYRDAVEAAVCLGGDSDTVAAITGAISGSELGPHAIPDEWLTGLREWPCSVAWMKGLSKQLDAYQEGLASDVPSFSIIVTLIRNLVFTLIVLGHGFRRLLPPY